MNVSEPTLATAVVVYPSVVIVVVFVVVGPVDDSKIFAIVLGAINDK